MMTERAIEVPLSRIAKRVSSRVSRSSGRSTRFHPPHRHGIVQMHSLWTHLNYGKGGGFGKGSNEPVICVLLRKPIVFLPIGQAATRRDTIKY